MSFLKLSLESLTNEMADTFTKQIATIRPGNLSENEHLPKRAEPGQADPIRAGPGGAEPGRAGQVELGPRPP